jgi:CPA2 family monovalent cation:H+ antiporter-2
VASTVVLLRALEERNALDSEAGRIAVGWLIVEDLAMVLALVLLPALVEPLGGDPRGLAARLGGGLAATLALTLGKLALFVALVLVVGMRVVPWLLVQVARTGSRELFTLSVLALALGIAYGSAELFGVSLALGAFFAGVVLSESDLSHQAAADSLPLQDAFAVLFFVSVGMLFDPSVVAESPLRVIEVLVVVVAVKSLPALALLLAAGQSLPTALTVTAGLAQIGEFSFIVAGLAVALGIMPPEGRDLILAGALLSIMLNPLVFRTLDPVAAWLRGRPGLLARLERSGGGRREPARPRRDVGYGRVGGTIGEELRQRGLPFVAVEQNRRRVEQLRAQGVPAIFGDAATPGVLEAAHIGQARLLVIATPESFQTRRIIELARQANPKIDTAVRTHSESEVAYLERQGVGIAIMGAREVALGLLDYALRSFGLSADKVRVIVQGIRTSGDAGAFERRPDVGPAKGAPELRPHRDASEEELQRTSSEATRNVVRLT